MLRLILFALVLFLLSPSAGADAPIPGKVSLDFTNADLVYVLKVLAKEAGLDVLVAPDVEGAVTTRVQNAAIAELLPSYLAAQQTRYVYECKNGIIRVAPEGRLRPVAPASELKGATTFDFVNADLQYVLKLLARESGRYLVVAGDVQGAVTITAKDRPINELLPEILGIQETEFEYELRQGLLLVAPAGRLQGGKR